MKKILLIFALPLVAFAIACNPTKKDAQIQAASGIEQKDSTKIQIDVNTIDSMSVIFTENEKTALIDISDREKLAELLSTARYDTLWNKGDIMVKMVAPDYMIISKYKNKSEDENNWMMIWKENGRTKYNDKWFFISDENQPKVYELLDKYK
ncbi:MAG: hypothetical protein ACK5M3_11070 [Dysgonomonas sp.]